MLSPSRADPPGRKELPVPRPAAQVVYMARLVDRGVRKVSGALWRNLQCAWRQSANLPLRRRAAANELARFKIPKHRDLMTGVSQFDYQTLGNTTRRHAGNDLIRHRCEHRDASMISSASSLTGAGRPLRAPPPRPHLGYDSTRRPTISIFSFCLRPAGLSPAVIPSGHLFRQNTAAGRFTL
jgi:hypothetical protein